MNYNDIEKVSELKSKHFEYCSRTTYLAQFSVYCNGGNKDLAEYGDALQAIIRQYFADKAMEVAKQLANLGVDPTTIPAPK